MPTTPTAPTAAAAAALADSTAQHQLLQSQLQAVTQELAQAEPGTGHHLSLAQRACLLREQVNEASRAVAGFTELAKGEEVRAQEAAAAATAAAAARAARIADDRARAKSLIEAINTASDQLARALAEAGRVLPPVIDDLASEGVLTLAGPWRLITPGVCNGSGKIHSIPYVSTEHNHALLTTRGHAGNGRHLG